MIKSCYKQVRQSKFIDFIRKGNKIQWVLFRNFIYEHLIAPIIMFTFNPIDQFTHTSCEQHIRDKSLQQLLSKKLTQAPKLSLPHQSLLLNKQNELITVPIKEYSNKFLRQKKKQEQQASVKKKQPFPNSHLYHNRKLISEFKKYKGRSQKFKSHSNKQNGDFIIYNLLFEKQDRLIDPQRKTIFGTFTQNFTQNLNTKINADDSSLFEKGWKTSKNGALFQAKKQVYEKICEKQRSLIPEHRKKCKTLVDSSNYEAHDNEKKFEKISTSRALQKYSKIIKVNPEHGKIEKMKIKKQLAKSLRFQSNQKSQIETKQIKLSKKQVTHRGKNMLPYHQASSSKKNNSVQMQNKENQIVSKTPEKGDGKRQNRNFITSQVGMFSSGVKFKKLRKFSHQVEFSNKKCITEEKRTDENTFDDFQINGWDINF